MTCFNCTHYKVCQYTRYSTEERLDIYANNNNADVACKDFSEKSLFIELPCKEEKGKKMTNFEKIKAMSVDDMVEAIHELVSDQCKAIQGCRYCIAEQLKIGGCATEIHTKIWLESEVKIR